MKTTVILLLLACNAWSATVAQENTGGRAAPPFEIRLLDDSLVRSSDLEGKVVVLFFARTTLPNNPRVPCARSIGLLGLFNEELFLRFRGEEDLVVLPVITRYRNKQEVARFRDKYGFHFPVGLDENRKVSSRFARDDAPRLFVIDREGNVTEVPTVKEFTGEERAAHQAATGKKLPASRLSLEAAALAVEEALAAVPRGGIAFRELTLADALAAAKEEGKTVLAACYFPWYATSQRMLKRVFTRSAAGEYCNARFVCVKLDMEGKDGARLQDRFDLPATELTTLLLDPRGKLLHRVPAAATVEEWLAGIKNAGDKQ